MSGSSSIQLMSASELKRSCSFRHIRSGHMLRTRLASASWTVNLVDYYSGAKSCSSKLLRSSGPALTVTEFFGGFNSSPGWLLWRQSTTRAALMSLSLSGQVADWHFDGFLCGTSGVKAATCGSWRVGLAW